MSKTTYGPWKESEYIPYAVWASVPETIAIYAYNWNDIWGWSVRQSEHDLGGAIILPVFGLFGIGALLWLFVNLPITLVCLNVFGPRRRSSFKSMRMAAIARMSDQNLIFETIRLDEDRDLRIAALNNLSDEKLLAQIAIGEDRSFENGELKPEPEKDQKLRNFASMKIANSDCLGEIAMNASYESARKIALENISDQSIILCLAMSCPQSEIQNLAIAKLQSQQMLEDVVKNASGPSAKIEATKFINDQVILSRIVSASEFNSAIFRAAFEKVNQDTALHNIAKTSSDSRVRVAAIHRIANSEYLMDIARCETDSEAMQIIARKMNHLPNLLEFASQTWDWDVLRIIASKVPDNEITPELFSKFSKLHEFDAEIAIREKQKTKQAQAEAEIRKMNNRKRNVCGKCGRSKEQIEDSFSQARSRGITVIGSGPVLLWCNQCGEHFCGSCQIDLGYNSGCPRCRSAID